MLFFLGKSNKENEKKFNKITQTSEVDVILRGKVNRESEFGTDGSFKPILICIPTHIPCVHRARVVHASGERPENLSPEAMGDARAWEAEQRLTVHTHTISETEKGE